MSILTWIEDKKRLKLLAAPKNVIATGEPPQDSSKGLWTRCDKCGVILYIKHLKENQRVCFGCSYHLQMMSGERIASLLDRVPVHSSKKERFAAGPSSRESLSSTWRPLDETVSPCDPLNFHDQKGYTDRLKDAQERTGLQDAIQTGTGMIDGIPVALAVMDFSFMGGSMGSVVGEKITRLIEYATGEGLTLLIVSASGGARMQEGVFSLMQMAKISSALQIHQSCAKLLYISILTSPTTGGVTASFAMLGDIIFAEPKAVIAFAGRRVIEQTLCEDLPDDFQTSEYMLHHGLVDLIVPRRFLRQALSETIRLYQNAPFKKRGSIPFGVQNPITFLTEEKIRRKWGLLTKRGTKALISQNMTLSSDRSARRTAYREILSSFEIVLNLFVSGNTQKIGEPSSFVASGSPSSFTKGDPESNKSAKDTELYKPLQSSALYVQQRFPADKVVLHGFAARSKSSLFTRFVATFKNGFSISDTPKKSQASALILGRDHKSSICTSSCQSFSGLTNLCPSKNPAFKGQRSVHPNTKNGSIPISEPITKSKISSKESFASKAKLYTHRLYKKRVANLSLKIDGDAVNGSAVRSPRYKHKSPRLTNKAVFCKPLPPAIKSKVPFCKNVCKAMKSFVCLYKTEFCIPFRSKISIDQSKNKGLRLSSFPCIRLKQSFLREASLESCNAKLYKNFDFALNNFTSTNLGDLRKVTKDGFVSKADQIFDLPVGTGGYIGRSLNTKKSTFEQRLVKSVVGKASLCRKAKSNPKVGARDEVSPSYLLHRFRAFSESLYTSNTDLVTKQGFSSRISRSAIGLAPTDLQHKNKIYNQNKLQKKQKQSSYKSKICSGRPNQSNKSSYVANKIFFAEGAFKRDAQLCKPETLLKSMQNESQKDSTSKFAIRKREKELTIDSTGRANDINFLNQAIELAATESVEWRAFYIHQQLSENMGFFEDFLQENPNLSKKRENMLFYKSICRSKKTLQVQPSVDKK